MGNVISWPGAVITAANTAKDGTGTVSVILTNTRKDLYLEKLIFRAAGTNVASVGRVFINNGSTNATAANNSLFAEKTLPATTLSEVAALADVEVYLGIWLPQYYRILVTLGTAVSAGYYVSAVGGKDYANRIRIVERDI